MFQPLLDSSLDEFLDILTKLEGWSNEERSYNSVYVSIGGKQNEPHQIFNYPTEIKGQKFRSNASNQMLPSFIANRRPDSRGDQIPDRILVIAVDTFRSEDEWNNNVRLLQGSQQTKKQSDTCNVNSLFDILLWNQEINSRTLSPFIYTISKLAFENGVSPNQFMICNYIRFSSPNEPEAVIEDYVPEQIQRLLDPTPYASQFYQWYGPSFYTYNLIYCFKEYDVWRSMYQTQLFHMFQRYSGKFHLRPSVFDSMKEACEDDSKLLVVVNQFLRCSVDITESYRKRGEIGSNLLM